MTDVSSLAIWFAFGLICCIWLAIAVHEIRFLSRQPAPAKGEQ